MLKLPAWCFLERTRMLVLMLAVILLVAALIIVSVWHLCILQRKKEIEAVIQREYFEILVVAEKRIDHRAYKMAEEIWEIFFNVDSLDELDDFLAKYSNVFHAFLWIGKGKLDFQSQFDWMDDFEFHDQYKMLFFDIEDWFDSEFKIYLVKLKRMEVGGHHIYFMSDWVFNGDKWQYVFEVFFYFEGFRF